jgi:hypothetical protein
MTKRNVRILVLHRARFRGVEGCFKMRNAFRFFPIAALAAVVTGCGGGGYGSPAVSGVSGSAGTTIPTTSSVSPLAIVRGGSVEVDAFAGATPYSYNVTSTNASCAFGTPATPLNSAAYGVAVTVPAAATAGCSAVLSVNFTQAGSSSPVLVDQIFVFAN